MFENLDHISGAEFVKPHVDPRTANALAESGHLARFGDYKILTTLHLAIPLFDNSAIVEKLRREMMEMYDPEGMGQITPRVRMTDSVTDIFEDAIARAQRSGQLAQPRDVLRALLVQDSNEDPELSVMASIKEDPKALLRRLELPAAIPLPAPKGSLSFRR